MIYVTKEMLQSGRPIRQGEVNIWLKSHAPAELLKDKHQLFILNGPLIIGHSETGHHHVLERVEEAYSPAAEALITSANKMIVELKLNQAMCLRHLRDTDTHETFVLPPGEYIRVIRRESTGIDTWRMTQD